MFDLKLVDNLVGITFGKPDLRFYLAGGSACIIAGYIDRMNLERFRELFENSGEAYV